MYYLLLIPIYIILHYVFMSSILDFIQYFLEKDILTSIARFEDKYTFKISFICISTIMIFTISW
jgi:hypothetical protein